MPTGEFFLRLQHGITGGFAPPTPNAIHTITQSSNSTSLMIASAVRPDGSPDLSDVSEKEISSSEQNTAALLEELYIILKSIPTELPPGSEDIYRMDTGIVWSSVDLQWANMGPEGCAIGVSTVQPTAEEKTKFKRAVEIVNELTGKNA